MNFEIISEITDVETIAIGSSIHEVPQLQARFGRGRWRKKKGVAVVRLYNGMVRRAEVHWYEAHGIGTVRMKIKRFMD